ncbi:protocadherin Fat 4-like [Mercenaria mercenaria]|uniref:protocadherin Fat 4-like n=1 Tax=Mercenaria mercenaria TaxID=6596 RepID=UPI00234F5AC2|nr:protocadherin Fat 4-like [Mercenaria mercenaria]
MKLKLWTICLCFHLVIAERAGIRHCTTSDVFGPSSTTGGTAGTATSYLMQDEEYQIDCCGVVNSVSFSGTGGAVTLQIWRQNANTDFELISTQDYTLSGSSFTPDDDKRVSFREGDLFGWTGGSINKAVAATKYLSWTSSSVTATSVGDTHAWYGETIDKGNEYLMKIVARESTAPYFKNLPTTLNYADTELLVGGVILLTLSYNDIDPDDATDLTISVSPAWSDLFELTTGTTPNLVKTKESLGPGTYLPVFRIEEGHCGQTASSTLTVSVTDSAPSIDNLPGFATVHEDDEDEALLHTVTMSDPTSQAMWCRESDWTIGSGTGEKPFIVKMISTAAGSSQAGIYLIEDPKLDYDATPTYDLTIECMDTYGNTVTGTFWVNVIKNQLPIFTNIPNMVEVDASTLVLGTVVFTVSTTDEDSDQITFTDTTCNPSGSCPFSLLDSGEVLAKENLLFHTAASSYTMSITATDVRDTTVARDLIIYIKNVNNDPTFSNVNGQSVSVDENSALGMSLYQMSATDADTADSLTYYMTIDDPEGYNLFELSSSGALTTHSTYSINFDILATTSYTLTVYVNDAKKQVSETFTASINNVNEAPAFLSSEYLVTQNEGGAGAFANDPGIGLAVDPDAGDTLTYSRDCGTTYDSYITINPTSGLLSFAQEYDLDNAALSLATSLHCTVYVTDAGGLNDSASLYIDIEYANDNSPVFNPSSYAVSVSSNTPMGFAIITVTATDADLGDDATLTYTLNQAGIGSGDLFIIKNGVIYATQLLTSLANAGSGTVTVAVTDEGGNVATATVTMTFIDSATVASITTDRNWEFIEDQRNITWLTVSVITIATCIFLIACAIIRSYMKRTTPLIDFKKLWQAYKPIPKPKRQLDKKRRPMPFGRQEAPNFRHVHANEILLPTHVSVASPAPVDNSSMRPDSGTSGRVTVTEVRVNENNWIDEYSKYISSSK